jgi:adrenodoxin-NADP+ reductase
MMQENAPVTRFFGNVRLGRDLRIQELRRMFDVIVLCTGASKSRVPRGLETPPLNVFNADSFVAWYNGTPQFDSSPSPDLRSGPHAVIIGNGNVALDAARLLLMSGSNSLLDKLPSSDISPIALTDLRESAIRHVRIVGRRSILQVHISSS